MNCNVNIHVTKLIIIIGIMGVIISRQDSYGQSDSYNTALTHHAITESGGRGVNLEDKNEIEDTIREINRYTLSDSLWKMWRAVADSQYVIPEKDSVQAEKLFLKGAKLARDAFNSIKAINAEETDSSTIRKTKVKAILQFEKARMYFEQTFKLNPYDLKTQNYLIWIFQNLAELHDHCNNTVRAINMLEYLTYIVNDDPALYYKLSKKYFNTGKWEKALFNIQSAIDLILSDDWNKIDTNYLFGLYYIKSNSEIQLNKIPEALQSLQYAKLIAPSDAESRRIQKKIKWINWDDGNLSASRKSDQLNYMLSRGESDYRTIKAEYTDLLKQVRTKRAKHDTHWRIAQLEFKFLDQKLLALERMRALVDEIDIDSTGRARTAEDEKYLEDYGSMCYNLGLQYLREKDYKSAFVYLYQSIDFQWSGLGKSYLQLSKLTSLDNKSSLKYANHALNLEDHLSIEEKNELYYVIYLAYKRMGRFDVARKWFLKTSNLTLSQ